MHRAQALEAGTTSPAFIGASPRSQSCPTDFASLPALAKVSALNLASGRDHAAEVAILYRHGALDIGIGWDGVLSIAFRSKVVKKATWRVSSRDIFSWA